MLLDLIISAFDFLELVFKFLVLDSNFKLVDELVLNRVLNVNCLCRSLFFVFFELVQLFCEVPVLIVDLILNVLELADSIFQSTIKFLYLLLFIRDLLFEFNPLIALFLDP